MMFTGQILAAPVFYGILNVLAVGMEYLVRTFAGTFLYGYSGYMPLRRPSPSSRLPGRLEQRAGREQSAPAMLISHPQRRDAAGRFGAAEYVL